jgi:hypothetical protein
MPPARHAAHDRRALAALVTAFALMVQALFPATVMAKPDPSGGVTICTATGTQVVDASGQPAAPNRGHDGALCQHCLAAAMSCAVTPELAVQPVTCIAARVEHAPVIASLQPRARAPPRPPGQGPPSA